MGYTITSDPKPSRRINGGYHYSYYDRPTSSGGQCTVVFPSSIAGVIKKGFRFEESNVRFDATLGASVLELDFDEPPHMEEPALPPDPESGWGDPDDLLAGSTRGAARAPSAFSQRRRVEQQAVAAGESLPPGLFQIAQEVARCFAVQYRMISTAVPDARRADIAQKLTAIACIPYYRSAGVAITEDDVKSMSL